MSNEAVCRTAPATPGLLNIFTKDRSVSELISDEGVCRTVPATTGLLITSRMPVQEEHIKKKYPIL